MRIQQASSTDELEIVRTLWAEYWKSLRLPDDFQNFTGELESLPGKYIPPSGRLLLANLDAVWAGTGALRPLTATSCEMKRLFVRPEFRGLQAGRALLDAIIQASGEMGYRNLVADTLPSMGAALKLYETYGFRQVGPYSDEPTPGAIYLSLHL